MRPVLARFQEQPLAPVYEPAPVRRYYPPQVVPDRVQVRAHDRAYPKRGSGVVRVFKTIVYTLIALVLSLRVPFAAIEWHTHPHSTLRLILFVATGVFCAVGWWQAGRATHG